MTRIRRIRRGSKIPPSGWNAMAAAAERVYDLPAGQSPLASSVPAYVQVKNTTDNDLPRFAVVGLDGLAITTEKNLHQFKNAPLFKAVKFQAEQHFHRYAVLQNSLKKQQIGSALIAGVTACKVYNNDDSDGFAGPADNQTGYLVSGYGNARILHMDSNDGQPSEQWAAVQLGLPGPQRWMPWENGTGGEMPAYGVIKLAAPSNPTTDNTLKGHSSNDAYRVPFAINYPVAVEDGGFGLCTMDQPAWIAHISDSAPNAYDLFGQKNAQNKLHRFGANGADIDDITDAVGGFRMIGPRRTNPDRALMEWDFQRLIVRPLIRFTLTSNLSTTSQSASVSVQEVFGNVGPQACDTVFNVLDDSNAPNNYIFSGAIGDTGLAFADPQGKRYYILWIECSASCG